VSQLFCHRATASVNFILTWDKLKQIGLNAAKIHQFITEKYYFISMKTEHVEVSTVAAINPIFFGLTLV
jgi:hypothetical protein